jgi:copper transport protein
VALFAGAAVLFTASGADAHALLRSSVPMGGARVEGAPERVTLTFTEQPELPLSSIEVVDTSGEVVSSGSLRPVGPVTLAVGVEGLGEGVYTVSWRVVSRVDGHATAGTFAFGVGVSPGVVSPGDAPTGTPPVSGVEVAGRWLFLGGVALLIGAAWVGALAFAVPPSSVGTLMLGAAGVATAGLFGLAVGQWQAAGSGLGALLSTPIGLALVLRTAALAGAGAVVGLWRPRAAGPARVGLVVAGALAASGALVHVTAGHAAASSSPALQVGAQWIHVVAGGMWLGGLAALLIGIRGTEGADRGMAVRRFSAVALVALLAVAATGVLRAISELSTWSDLWTTGYGRRVALKAALIVALAVLGGINRYRNVPTADASVQGLRRLSRAELTLGVAVIAAAAFMASISPPYAPAAARTRVAAAGTDFAGTVRARLTVEPGTAGPNRFALRLTDPDDGSPIDADEVTLRFAHLQLRGQPPNMLALKQTGPGAFAADGANVFLAGRWEVVVRVQRAMDTVEIPLTVGTSCDVRSLGGEPPIYSIPVPGGTAQGYVEPGTAGSNEVHITYFDQAGGERDIRDDVAVTASSGATTISLDPRRLSPGHFVAGADLAEGRWRFDVAATDVAGDQVPACFRETIGGEFG